MNGKRRAPAPSGARLIRSRIEIARLLEVLRADGATITAEPEGSEHLFLTRLLGVDARQDALVLACGASKQANAAVLALARLRLHCMHAQARLEFVCAAPCETQVDGELAIRLRFPRALLELRRRVHPRIQIPPEVPLRCELDWGPLSFEAQVVDVSPGGLGTLVYDAAIRLTPGTRLPRVRIYRHGETPIVVSLEVRNISGIRMVEGRALRRAGFRLRAGAADLARLLASFVTEIPVQSAGTGA